MSLLKQELGIPEVSGRQLQQALRPFRAGPPCTEQQPAPVSGGDVGWDEPYLLGGMAPSQQGCAAPRLATSTSPCVTGRRARVGRTIPSIGSAG
jgi:hypothetical protein